MALQMRSSQAMELGLNYLSGHNAPRDPAKAAQLLQQAAAAGETEAQTRLGSMYQTGTGVPQDFALALHWYQLGASSGSMAAKIYMGLLYARGNGVPQDPALAMQWFHEGFDKGYGAAAAYIGEMYFMGAGMPQDKQEAEKWFEKGARMRDPVSTYDLGVLCAGQYGHAKNLPRAAEMFRRAAKQDYIPAKYSLGLLITQHPELSAARDEARKSLESASQSGFWKADAVLGIMWRDGDGVAKDPASALFYFKLASAQGGDSARKLLHNDLLLLEARIPPDSVTEIAARADEWAKSHPPEFLLVNSGKGGAAPGGLLGASEPPGNGKSEPSTPQPPPA
jgi:hypothetical protein